MRDPYVQRGTTAVAAGAAGVRANLAPNDRLTGSIGGAKIRLSVPAASAGDIFVDISCGNNYIAPNWGPVPVEEFVGSGPNLRMPAVPITGKQGDPINIVYRNADAANAAVVTHHVEIANVD